MVRPREPSISRLLPVTRKAFNEKPGGVPGWAAYLQPAILIPAIVALCVTVLASFMAYQYGLTTQIKLSERQEKRRAYADLTGLKALLRQLLVSRIEAAVLVDYYHARWKLSGAPKDGFELQEAISNVRNVETLTLEVAKTNQKLFETIGVIRTTYPDTPKLRELTDRIYNFLPPQVLGDASTMKPDELETWKRTAIKNLQEFIDREYSKPMENLITYLAADVPRDSK